MGSKRRWFATVLFLLATAVWCGSNGVGWFTTVAAATDMTPQQAVYEIWAVIALTGCAVLLGLGPPREEASDA